MQAQTEKLKTNNGYFISLTQYSPDTKAIGAVIVVPAMGVTQNYYAAFSKWLANQGYLVTTFDYSGTGQSKSGNLRDLKVDIRDWAESDCAAALAYTISKAAQKPLFWIGHSLGGQILGLMKQHKHISKAITIASGSGYWRENVPALKWRVWWLWYVVAPLATRLCGYFPGKRLRKVGDLPTGVIMQWRRWCLNAEYLIGVEGDAVRAQYKAVQLPMTSISFSDDELMSQQNIDSLHHFYTPQPKTMIRISAQDIGVKRIGHFGFFKPQFEQSLWERYLLPELN